MANTLFPVTNTIVPSPSGFSNAIQTFVKKGGNLYPVTHKFVTKVEDNWLDGFQGGILECYNSLPLLNWGWSDPTGHEGSRAGTPNGLMYGTRTINFTFANRNFATDTTHPWLPWSSVNDVLGIYLTYRDENNETAIWTGGSWEDMIYHYLANGGGRGICISPYQTTDFFFAYDTDRWGNPIPYGNPQRMPVAHTAPNSNGIVRLTDTISTDAVPGTFGFYYEMIQRNNIFPSDRSKDMVLWIYQCDIEGGHNIETINTGIFDPSYLNDWNAAENRFDFKIREYPPNPLNWAWFMGTTYHIDDDISTPGSTAIRLISNQYKYAPWERYPHLL